MRAKTMWNLFDQGKTIGSALGDEVVCRDEVNEAGGRVILLRGGPLAPFTVVSQIRERVIHRAFALDREGAHYLFNAMKEGLDTLGEPGIAPEEFEKRIGEFVSKF